MKTKDTTRKEFLTNEGLATTVVVGAQAYDDIMEVGRRQGRAYANIPQEPSAQLAVLLLPLILMAPFALLNGLMDEITFRQYIPDWIGLILVLACMLGMFMSPIMLLGGTGFWQAAHAHGWPSVRHPLFRYLGNFHDAFCGNRVTVFISMAFSCTVTPIILLWMLLYGLVTRPFRAVKWLYHWSLREKARKDAARHARSAP